jgi:hypothetical protein
MIHDKANLNRITSHQDDVLRILAPGGKPTPTGNADRGDQAAWITTAGCPWWRAVQGVGSWPAEAPVPR